MFVEFEKCMCTFMIHMISHSGKRFRSRRSVLVGVAMLKRHYPDKKWDFTVTVPVNVLTLGPSNLNPAAMSPKHDITISLSYWQGNSAVLKITQAGRILSGTAQPAFAL
eukprot:1388937-Amorphochlora_amoeboformis.AAC.1